MREREEGREKAMTDKLDSMAKLITAESKEQGQQLDEITAFVQAFTEREKVLTEQQGQPEGVSQL
jgi:hypothetical protein